MFPSPFFNFWCGLFGLAKSLRAQGRTDEAAEVEKRFRTAWANADVELKSTRSIASGVRMTASP